MTNKRSQHQLQDSDVSRASADSPSRDRVSRERLRQIYLKAVASTSSLSDTKESWYGFICGFRAYERIAGQFGVSLSDDEVKFVTGAE